MGCFEILKIVIKMRGDGFYDRTNIYTPNNTTMSLVLQDYLKFSLFNFQYGFDLNVCCIFLNLYNTKIGLV